MLLVVLPIAAVIVLIGAFVATHLAMPMGECCEGGCWAGWWSSAGVGLVGGEKLPPTILVNRPRG